MRRPLALDCVRKTSSSSAMHQTSTAGAITELVSYKGVEVKYWYTEGFRASADVHPYLMTGFCRAVALYSVNLNV